MSFLEVYTIIQGGIIGLLAALCYGYWKRWKETERTLITVNDADDKALADMTRRALDAERKLKEMEEPENVYPAVCPGHPGNTGF